MQSLSRGLAVLTALGGTLSEIAEATGLARATARRALLTLVALGYAVKSGNRFVAQPKVLELGYARLSSLTLGEIATPHLTALAEAVRESASVAVLDGTDIRYVARAPAYKIMSVDITVGTRFPAYATSMGRVLLAEDAELGELTRLTRHTVTDPEAVRKLIRQAHSDGYAIVVDELEEGLRALGVPIRDRDGRVVAAVNVATTGQVRPGLLAHLQATAHAVETDLRAGHRTNPAPAGLNRSRPGIGAAMRRLLARFRLGSTARSVFGWQRLRPGQKEAMRHLVAGRDVLLVMPTGGGKSAVYQVPALLLDGPTIVVSPLIALQRDQVMSLLKAGTGAVAVNSTQSVDKGLDQVTAGTAEFVFLSPEQLAKPEVVERLAAARPSLIAIDEAHCVSSWGHDFRPDYLRLGQVIEKLGHPPVVALTATAAPNVRAEIVRSLGLRDPVEIVRGFDRPNLTLSARRFTSEEDRRRALVEHARKSEGLTLIYVPTRRETEEYCALLTGKRAEPYHAGMKTADRNRTHTKFAAGELDVVVATSAFGMGIDRPDVRRVLHAGPPESPDSYYQEIGRAGPGRRAGRGDPVLPPRGPGPAPVPGGRPGRPGPAAAHRRAGPRARRRGARRRAARAAGHRHHAAHRRWPTCWSGRAR